MKQLATESFTRSKLVINEFVPGETITVASGQGTIAFGQALGRNYTDGKYYKYSSSATDGTQNPCRIYKNEESIDTTAADVLVPVMRAGIANSGAIVGLTIASDFAGIAKLEECGIYLEAIKI